MHQLSAQALQRPESPIQNKGCMAISLHGQKLSDFLAPIVLHLAQLTIFQMVTFGADVVLHF